MKRGCLISLLVAVSIVVILVIVFIFVMHGCDECKTGKPELHLTGPVVKEWIARNHDGAGSAYPDMAIDSGGNVYVVGSGLLKYNHDGELLRVDSADKVGAADKIAIDESDNIYLAGDTFVAKYNAEGDQLWMSYYGSGKKTAIGIDKVGNVYVTCLSWEDIKESVNYSTVKYDPHGVELWRKTYSAIKPTSCNICCIWNSLALVVTSENRVCITGCYVTFAYDQDGNELWTHPLSEGRAIAADESGNVCVMGNNETIMYDSKGTELWRAQGESEAVVIDSAGNVFTTGDDGTSKYTNSGQLLWTRQATGEYIAADNQGGVFVALSSGGPVEDYDLNTGRYDSGGNVIWAAEYDGPASHNDWVRGLKVDGNGHVYIIGDSTYKSCSTGSLFEPESTTYSENVLIKFSQK